MVSTNRRKLSESFKALANLKATKSENSSLVDKQVQANLLECKDAAVQVKTLATISTQTTMDQYGQVSASIPDNDKISLFLSNVEPLVSRLLIRNANSVAMRGWIPSWVAEEDNDKPEGKNLKFEHILTLDPKLPFLETAVNLRVETCAWSPHGLKLAASLGNLNENSEFGFLCITSILHPSNVNPRHPDILHPLHSLVTVCKFFESSWLFCGCADGSICLYRLDDSELETVAKSTKNHMMEVTALDIHRRSFSIEDSLLVSGGIDGNLIVWSVDLLKNTLIPLRQTITTSHPITSLRLCGNTLLCGYINGLLISYDFTSLSPLLTFLSRVYPKKSAHLCKISGIALLDRSFDFLTVSEDSSLKLWSLVSNTPTKSVHMLEYGDYFTGIASNGKIIACGGKNGQIIVFSTAEIPELLEYTTFDIPSSKLDDEAWNLSDLDKFYSKEDVETTNRKKPTISSIDLTMHQMPFLLVGDSTGKLHILKSLQGKI